MLGGNPARGKVEQQIYPTLTERSSSQWVAQRLIKVRYLCKAVDFNVGDRDLEMGQITQCTKPKPFDRSICISIPLTITYFCFCTSASGDLAAVKQLVNEVNELEETVLFTGAEKGHIVVKELLKYSNREMSQCACKVVSKTKLRSSPLLIPTRNASANAAEEGVVAEGLMMAAAIENCCGGGGNEAEVS
ncbi:hypothetical protein Nepgr_014162 [Nepenthes gracilis]|uniref:Uncharacterized protein n=1 Tax=Nepenthes gracilis TaxID=150966 RepID=A0AAD3SKI1_NEPGR|nr:hypothetical protein Nepgr_014162 [Nepenthes gracilis]